MGPARRLPGPALPARDRPAPLARLFDTELAGRLLGFARVGLVRAARGGARLLASPRSTPPPTGPPGPLPEPWLRYAALDVELLVELRDALEEQLRRAAGKLELGAAGVRRRPRRAPPAAPRVDPVAAHVRHAQAPPAPSARPWSARCGSGATTSPAAATPRPAASCPTPRSSPPPLGGHRRPRPSPPCRRTPGAARGGTWATGRRRWSRRRSRCRTSALPAAVAAARTARRRRGPGPTRDPDAAARLAVTRGGLTELAARARPARGEPRLSRPRPPHRLEPAAAPTSRARRGRAARRRRPRVAGRAGRPRDPAGLEATAADLAAAAAERAAAEPTRPSEPP